MNFFKNIIPNIYGIDPADKYADETASFNPEFIRNNQEKFESAISINALHFFSVHDFGLIVTNFWETIKPGGRGYITFNLARIIEFTLSDNVKIELFGTKDPQPYQFVEYICEEIKKLNIDFLYITKNHKQIHETH